MKVKRYQHSRNFLVVSILNFLLDTGGSVPQPVIPGSPNSGTLSLPEETHGFGTLSLGHGVRHHGGLANSEPYYRPQSSLLDHHHKTETSSGFSSVSSPGFSGSSPGSQNPGFSGSQNPPPGFNFDPEFVTQSQFIKVELGDTVVLPCRVRNQGSSIVLWKQGERVISAGPIQVRKDERLTLVEASSLRIIGVDVIDSGNYTCEIEWTGRPKRITHHLQVQVPPRIEAVLPGGFGRLDRPIEAREGSSVRLECKAEGIPKPTVTWRKSDGEFPHSLSTKLPKGPILHIGNVKKEDDGTYVCAASNGVGSIAADQIELRVLFPPEVTSSDRTVHAWPGGRADLKCIVKAEPKATVSWYLEGQRVVANARHVLEEHDTLALLRLRDISIGDLGNYSCVAENSQGRATDHIEMSGKPERATINSSPEALYRTSYNLTWSVRSQEPLSEARILFRKLDPGTTSTNYNNNLNGSWNNILLRVPSFWRSRSSSSRSDVSSSSSSSSSFSSASEWIRRTSEYHVQSHVFSDLDANTRYEVIVQTKNVFGWSEPTPSFIFQTRIRDYSPKSFASHPSFRASSASTAFSLSLLNVKCVTKVNVVLVIVIAMATAHINARFL